MSLKNLSFLVHPQVFIIHMPHEHTINGWRANLAAFPQKLKLIKHRLRMEKCGAMHHYKQTWEAPTVMLSREDPHCQRGGGWGGVDLSEAGEQLGTTGEIAS